MAARAPDLAAICVVIPAAISLPIPLPIPLNVQDFALEQPVPIGDSHQPRSGGKTPVNQGTRLRGLPPCQLPAHQVMA